MMKIKIVISIIFGLIGRYNIFIFLFFYSKEMKVNSENNLTNYVDALDKNKNFLTKEVMQFYLENIDKYNPYNYTTINEINQIEEFLNCCNINE